MTENTENNNSFNIITHINELMFQTEVTQYFKNTKDNPIELEMVLPNLTDCNITRFEVIKNNQRIISKLLEKGKAEEKYNDTISTGNSSFLSYISYNLTKVCLGNISPGEEIELKTFFFGHVISKDISYQATFPVIFPDFILEDPKAKQSPEHYNYLKKIVKGKIYINTRTKITRLVVCGSKNFDKIDKKISDDKKSVEIDIYKDDFSSVDIPGIILFRTEKMDEDLLYYQKDLKRNKSYYMLQKFLNKPEFTKEFKDEIDDDENLNYFSLLKRKDEEEKKVKECYIFLLDQSGSMGGSRIELSCKSLLLFLQSLNKNCYFQLIGFGSTFEFFSEKPLEYNKENIKNLMKIIKNLKANKGGTELFEPLNKIYNDKIYNEYNMKKYIILLTDGELHDKEKVINLIGANSSKFFFNSIGIGECDKDLIERTALVGNGYSYFISDLDDLNSEVISLLEKNRTFTTINCTTNQKCSTEENNKKLINKYDFFTHGFILDDINIKDIEFNINIDDENLKLSINKDKIIKLPDGDNLGKLIVDNYLKNSNCKISEIRINLAKEYNILTKGTAFYAKIVNEVPVKEKMIKITNKDKEASNNKKEENVQTKNNIEENSEYIYKDEIFGYDEYEEPPEEEKSGFFGFFSKLFSKDSGIIKKKNLEYKPPKYKPRKTNKRMACYESAMLDCCRDAEPDFHENLIMDINDIKKDVLNFDELILNQDILEGNWEKDEQSEILMEQEKDIYEKIKKYSEDKNINDENVNITLLVLFYIYNKKNDKVNELKFIIDKAKKYVKKIFNLEYETIIKEIEAK